jgi:hypothetical protein
MKLVLLVLLAATAAVAAVLAVRSREEIDRYRTMRRM